MASRHKRILEQYCRLCGQKKAATSNPQDRKPCHKEKYDKAIKEVFDLDVCDEDCNIFPPYLCRACEMKLYRHKEMKKQKKTFTITVSVKQFQAHNDAGCEICSSEDFLPIEDIKRSGKKASEECGFSVSWQPDRSLFFSVCVKEESLTVPKCITLYNDGTWDVSIVGQKLDCTNDVVQGIPKVLDEQSVQLLVRNVSQAQICKGNADFVSFVKEKAIQGYIVDFYQSVETVRSTNCRLVVCSDADKCSVCTIQRSDLISMRNRKKMASPMKARVSSKAKLHTLTKRQLIKRAKNLQRDRVKVKQQQKRLKDRVQQMFEHESVVLKENSTKCIEKVVEQASEEIEKLLEKDSPQQVLWQEQMKVLKLPDRKQVRWHPTIIRWAIAIHSKSPAAYKLIKDSGFMILPAIGTLHRYTHFADAKTGVHCDIIQQMLEEVSLEKDWQRNVTLVCDEMKVKSGLAYSTSTGQLLGFVDVGDINNEFREFETQVKKDSSSELASHAFVIMVRGLFCSMKQAVAFFPTSTLRSGEIYDCVMRTVLKVETAGLKVRAIVSDGASCNRKFYKMCMVHGDGYGHYTMNPAETDRKIYFFCDVPHLLKTSRNNLENSGFNRQSRNLQIGEKHIRWTHLIQLYEWDSSSDLRLLPRLTPEHLYLNPSLRMRVKLATQVLSQSVANAFKLMSQKTGDTSTDGTRQYVEMFNKFFDCLNVSTVSEGQRKRNPNMMPYRSVNDSRFEWLTDVFLRYIKDWEQGIADTPNLSALERERRCISKETREGLRITVASFVACTKELLQEGVEYVLSEKFSQDPIEEYFSKQRRAGGSSDNPTVQQVANNMLTFQVAGAAVRASTFGNVTKRGGTEGIPSLPLPKRKKHKK
ncbi:uncharacterized protein [Diadema antillarum]|uniref:uncharacterized protein n=1 Tax=Diadema antillarum TaxID=105358 RepID=UPI003A84B98C